MMEEQSTPVVNETSSTIENQGEEIVEVQDSSDRQEKSEPKKLGRPFKSRNRQKAAFNTEMPQKKRRESQRIKSIRKTVNYSTSPKRNGWSNFENLQLMKGLEEYGTDNIQGIMEFVKNRTEKEIKNKIKEWEDFARKEIEKKSVSKQKKNYNATEIMVAKLDKWLEYFKSETDTSCPSLFTLSNTLLLIAEYGKFPPPEECNQVDFRAFFRTLHCMVNGKPFYGLNQATAKLVQSSFGLLTKKLNKAACAKHFEPHLLNCTPHKKPIKNYGRPPYRGTRAPMNSQPLMEMPGMNPLNLPMSALTPLKLPGLDTSRVEEEEDSSEESSSSDDE